MSNNSPSNRAQKIDEADGRVRLGFPTRGSGVIGTCLRNAFEDRERKKDIPEEFNELLDKLR